MYGSILIYICHLRGLFAAFVSDDPLGAMAYQLDLDLPGGTLRYTHSVPAYLATAASILPPSSSENKVAVIIPPTMLVFYF